MINRLKRQLRPARPILLPVWRRLRPLIEPSTSWRTSRQSHSLDGATAIRPLTKAEFDDVARRHPYYRARGRYLSVAAALAGDLIASNGLRSALELGPNLQPLVVGADVMDIRAQPELLLPPPARFLLHDATRVPWPVADKQYDLFVALQVFEHLRDQQNAAFLEVCRVARHALISVPIDWEMDDPRNCHHRISEERALAWFRPFLPTRLEVGNPGSRKRLIYVFENLDTAPTGSPEAPRTGAEPERDYA